MNNVNQNFILPILGTLIIAILPHIIRLPFWIICWCVFFWSYVGLRSKYKLFLPNAILRQILAIGGFVGICLSYKHAFGRDASVGLLSVMLGLKPLEIDSYRDRMVTIFLAYFLVITNLFYFESFAMTIYMLLSVLITTTVLIHINHPPGRLEEKLKLSAIILAKAFPLMIFLFLLFPRIQGSLWGIGARQSSLSGFSDHLTLREVSRVILSHEIAFRAEFKGKPPAQNLLYWRGIVLWQFDGDSWRQGTGIVEKSVPPKGKDEVEYSITIEPQNQKWMFALDIPSSVPSNSEFKADNTIISMNPIRVRTKYSLKSVTRYATGNLKDWEKKKLIFFGKKNSEALALGNKWANETKSPFEIVNLGINFFKENNFSYTLNPPILGKRVIDDFLFNTKKGFCEHFASSFAFLMRAAGVPSRIILGYQGGEYNPIGNYYIVRQSDAHAWVEVSLPDKGWVRIDPTSMIAPERTMTESLWAIEKVFGKENSIVRLMKQIDWIWDTVNSRWNQWVMDYTFLEQQKLLSTIGIHINSWKGILKMVAIIVMLIALMIIYFIIQDFHKHKRSKDKVRDIYQKFCKKLLKAGIVRKTNQGPIDYAKMVNNLRNDLKEEVNDITDIYIKLRYGKGGDEFLHKQLKQLVNNFKPKPSFKKNSLNPCK